MHLFRRFHDSASGATSYLLGSSSGISILIDPIKTCEPLYMGVLEELGLHLSGIFETHARDEQESGTGSLCQQTGASLGRGRAQGDADILLDDGDVLRFGELSLTAIATPGYSPGCTSYLWQDRLFTGRCLLIGGWSPTLGAESNPGQLYTSITQQLMGFPDEYLVFPGLTSASRWVSCIGEERKSNPIFRGMSRDEFITLSSQKADNRLPCLSL